MQRAFSSVLRAILLLCAATLVAGCDLAGEEEPETHAEERLAGGETTVFEFNSLAFSTRAPNLSAEVQAQHDAGDAAFEDQFVTAPAAVNGGLGPLFNSNACIACHARDGRTPGKVLLHASAAGREGPRGGPAPAPGFGLQIQDRALFSKAAEARVAVAYEPEEGAFADGTLYELRRPTYRLEAPYRALPEGLLLSPRAPRPIFGLGLLEAVPAAAIRALADPDDADGDGISGEANEVWDRAAETVRLGRFGWKAERATVLQQTADAYAQDMGVTSSALPEENTNGLPEYVDGEPDDPELPEGTLDDVVTYVKTLGVPARRQMDDPAVRRGRALFDALSCQSCHVRKLRTGTADIAALSDQTIYPYTDLLLHDMGDGLADGRPLFEASGREWRTPPLWGLGLSRVVNGEAGFLHDGRARTVEEAILWHGGEAEAAKEQFRRLSEAERSDLLAFLRSL